MRSILQSGWTLPLLTLTGVLFANGHGCALGETCVQVEQIDSTLWFNALARIIRQLCSKFNLYGVLVFNIPGLQNGLNTFQQECCRPGHFWGEDQSWRSPNKCHYVKVSFFASWYFLSQPSIAAVFYLPSHHPRASLATSAQGNCLQRSPSNGEKASTASTTLSVLFPGLLMASPVPHRISSCSLSTSIIADFNLTIRWGDKKCHTILISTIYINFTWLTRSKYETF